MEERSGNVIKEKKGLSAAWHKRLFLIAMMAIPIAHFLVFFVYINVDTIALSFKTLDRSASSDGSYVWVGWQNYAEIFRNMTSPYSVILKAIRNSLLLFALNNFILLPLGIVFSYVLSKDMPGAKVFRVVFYLPSIISVVVLTMLFAFVFDSTNGIINPILKALHLESIIPEEGWLMSPNTAMKMVLLYCFIVGIGGNIPLLSGAIGRIPEELKEAARLDGIGFWGELVNIVFPLIGTTVSTLYMFGTTVIFTIFLQPKLLTNGGPDGETYTIALYIVQSIRESGELTMGAAVGILCAVIGTPIVIGTKRVLEKIFPVYEY